jgi:hypothetical protein
MPGVNGICNTKVSLGWRIFELLLRRDAARRNFLNGFAKRHGDCAAFGK